MTRTTWAVGLIWAMIAGSAVSMSLCAHCRWPGAVGLGVLGVFAVALEVCPSRLRGLGWKLTLTGAFLLTLLVPSAALFANEENFILEGYIPNYEAALAWLVAVPVLGVRICGPRSRHWKLPAIACAGFTGGLWLATAWVYCLRCDFYAALLAALTLLILCKLWFRLPAFAILTANTILLFGFGLGTMDLFVPPPPRIDPHLATARRYYSFENARKDPLAFACWWDYFVQEWLVMSQEVISGNYRALPSSELKAGSRSRLFDCPISINSLGFRGREITREKGNAYRIVALGESTTFGCTLGAEDKPWPELLEQMIRQRLKPDRPVEVVNAGVPGHTLQDSLYRLARDFLPLQPDMFIVYHGYNGFPLLDESLPPIVGDAPPLYRPRPFRLVARAEYRLKMLFYRRRLSAKPAPHPQTLSDVMDSKYARAYRDLVQAAQTNHIRLVLGNFSMAANGQSPAEVVDFYRSGFPYVNWQIHANVLHAQLVERIARQHPEICFVDTHPHLDGEHERFVDLVHLTQEGRQQLAETFFAAIRPILEQDLPHSTPSSATP
jgi:lysophospholipase L1-like esterase